MLGWILTKYHHWGSNAKGPLEKVFSIGKLTTLRRVITTFSQNKKEQLNESYERLKELL